MHPGIAPDLLTGAVRNGSSPLLQYVETGNVEWNHGEGFAPAGSPVADYGGWFDHDDGAHITAAQVHTPLLVGQATLWHSLVWTDSTHPNGQNGGTTVQRLYGYLRPLNVPLPSIHPIYGTMQAGSGPFGNGKYVDQGAFEMFRPLANPTTNSKIVICINTRETTVFPKDHADRRFNWTKIYPGIFSPDGLWRREKLDPVRSLTNFQNNWNWNIGDVFERPDLAVLTLPTSFYPIMAYAVPSVVHRQTTLNEQRDFQMLQAVKAILMEDPILGRNPMPAALNQAQMDSQVYCVFFGGSNGGHQAMWSALRRPDLVHGNFSEVINPSVQRMFGEHDLKHAVSQLSGAGAGNTTIDESDFLHWGKYAWDQGYWIHDISQLARFARGQLYRPACFRNGDEDITSTGVDWVRVISGAWLPSRAVNSNSSFGSPTANRFGWMIGENACHERGYFHNAYTGGGTFHGHDVLQDLIQDAIAQRYAQVLGSTPLPAPPASQPRSPSQEMRGLDDPNEWALGRPGPAMTTSSPALVRDDAWFHATQPGAAGTMLGYKEAMLIRGGALFVGSTEGVVSKFVVENTSSQNLKKVAHSNPGDGSTLLPLGTPMGLGHQAFAMTAVTAGNGWELVVGTRRHLHRLSSSDLHVISSVQLPWEIGQPRHMQVGDVLPSSINAGPEIVFCSAHGGLVFYKPDLTPIYEWTEPGIADFVLSGPTVSILSHRGVIANVQFIDNNGPEARLAASSKPIQRGLLMHLGPSSGHAPDPVLDLPCQGKPGDLELMTIDLSGLGAGTHTTLVSSWDSDEDNGAVRAHNGSSLTRLPITLAQNLIAINDIATCNQPPAYAGSSQDAVGDHLLVLSGAVLRLYNQLGMPLGEKILSLSAQGGLAYYPFGSQSHAICVGELVTNGGTYSEEVVVATTSGALMWMHVNDLMTPSTVLPSPTYDLATGSGIQPRTNQSLAACWAVSRRAGDNDLHVLDQRGAYWRVTHGGAATLAGRDFSSTGARGWSDLGNRVAGVHQPITNPLSFNTNHLRITNNSGVSSVDGRPWCPKDGAGAFYERSPYWIHSNWDKLTHLGTTIFEGFAVHPLGGSVLDRTQPVGREAWFWSAREGWGNLLQGFRFDTSSWGVTGIWASTSEYNVSNSDKCAYHEMRSLITHTPALSQQSIRAVELSTGDIALVLGCPGGRIRVVRPGEMRTGNDGEYHDIGTLESTPTDFGLGGSALDVRAETNGSLTIWTGTLYGPCAPPADYTNPTGSLNDNEVAAGTVHRLTWTPGYGFSLPSSKELYKGGSLPRGGYGVVGLKLANLLPAPGSEVIVCTLAGDIIVMDEGLNTVLWTAHLPGSAGFYNSIHVQDLDNDTVPELYVSGSFGLWRFTLPGE